MALVGSGPLSHCKTEHSEKQQVGEGTPHSKFKVQIGLAGSKHVPGLDRSEITLIVTKTRTSQDQDTIQGPVCTHRTRQGTRFKLQVPRWSAEPKVSVGLIGPDSDYCSTGRPWDRRSSKFIQCQRAWVGDGAIFLFGGGGSKPHPVVIRVTPAMLGRPYVMLQQT